MAYGSFVDIQQQDGYLQRMHYESTGVETVAFVKWVGAQEQMHQKFRDAVINTSRDTAHD